MQKGFCPKQGKSLKNYAILEVSCKPRGTILSARKHVFEKSVAKTVVQKVPSPERRINTGFFGTSKPRETIPTRQILLYGTVFSMFSRINYSQIC